MAQPGPQAADTAMVAVALRREVAAPAPERVHADLVAWGVLEPGQPLRFSRRFRGALARAAAGLQALERANEKPDGNPVERQVEAALAEFVKGNEVGPEHRAFVQVVHVASLPEAVRRFLGV